MTALGGLATSAIVASGGDSRGWKIAIAVIGVMVGVLAVFNQIRQPGRRNSVYAEAWQSLRTEGWCYLEGLGRYAGLNDDEAFRQFAQRVLTAPVHADRIAEPGTSGIDVGQPATGHNEAPKPPDAN